MEVRNPVLFEPQAKEKIVNTCPMTLMILPLGFEKVCLKAACRIDLIM